MGSPKDHKEQVELWNKVKDKGGTYTPRDTTKVKGAKKRQNKYLSPYKRARNAYFREKLGSRYIRTPRRINDIVSKSVKDNYIARARRMEADIAPLKTELWKAYMSSHISFLGNGVFWHDDIHWRSDHGSNAASERAGDDFYDVYKRQDRLKDNELPVFNTPNELAKSLGLTIPELRWLCYHRDAATYVHYHTFEIPKKPEGTRTIWAPNAFLKERQRWILDNIIHKMPVHGAAHGFVPGCSIGTNAQVHLNASKIISMDIKDFFPTFTFRRVKGVFRQMGYLEGVATILGLICTEAPRERVKYKEKTYYVAVGDRCLPQGSPASPGISNLACMRLDRRLTGLASSLGWRYSRYADDITFSFPQDAGKEPSKKNIQQIIDWIKGIVQDEGFCIHDKKTKVMGLGGQQKVTGLVVNKVSSQTEETPRVPSEVKKILRSAIYNLKEGRGFYEGESIQTLLGYASFVYSVEPEQGQKFINELLELPEGIGTDSYSIAQAEDNS